MSQYNIVSMDTEATVVAEYTPEERRADSYQSEAQLEQEFIERLQGQGYEYIQVKNEAELIANLRRQLEALNNYTFSDDEWARFFRECIAGANDGIVEKTRRIQDDHVQILKRDDGSTKNICLIDKKNIHNNRLQVLNQYEEAQGTYQSRYDVTVLVNGLPLVHIELKRRGVAIREAFNQIKRYQRDSFWAASGLFEYVQIFVISNGTHTKYYSNTTRNQHIKEMGGDERRSRKKTSNSFEFTSYWADATNRVIGDLTDFTKTFFAKHTILNILTRYCVFTSEELLLVMRPYQIAATERILNRIEITTNYKKYGKVAGGGYIWHTTGSGKTLTSFKTAQLASAMPGIDKVLFVVDRKDLDYQTMKEYDRFQRGAANSNTSTAVLKRQLEDPSARIIITTIQKLGIFVGKNKKHPVFDQHVVLIFDECHRSQFGEMHKVIAKAFRKYHIFGFTGTPIFSVNAGHGGNPFLRTTEQAFGDKLHTYTIVDAINDGNVLPFRIDYVNTIKMSPDVQDTQVRAIDVERAMSAPERVREIVKYILDHFDQKTYRNQNRSTFLHRVISNVEEVAVSKRNSAKEKKETQRVNGFNSIFAVPSIPMAMKYYMEIQRQLEERGQKLNVATIFSYCANEDDPEDALPDEGFENDKLDKTSRDFLESAIADYNAMFSVNYDTSADKFPNYYKDLSLRVKNREVDLLIIVNMFLTGFDATTLNTLWVDKNLRQHGLIQAFSRTNRILNSVKTFGNIVCFRDLKKATDDAIALFGDREAGGIVLLKTYNDYYNGYEENGNHKPGYTQLIELLVTTYPLGAAIIGEMAQKDFIRLFGAILRLKNILTSFDEFAGNEMLSQRDFQDYQSMYLDLYQLFTKGKQADRENINDDIIFEIELIKQIEVNIDYILMLVAKYHESNCTDKNILTAIDKAVSSSLELRSKKELIEGFIARVNTSTQVDDDWQKFVLEQKETDLSTLIDSEKLKATETRRFVDNAFRDGSMKTTGTDVDKILPPVSRFGGGGRAAKKQDVIDKLITFFEKYLGLVQQTKGGKAMSAATINKNTLQVICQTKQVTADFIARKVGCPKEKVDKWIDPTDALFPTIVQAKKVAKCLHIPFAGLYIQPNDVPIKRIAPLQNFRTFPGGVATDDSALHIGIYDLEQAKDFYLETCVELGVLPMQFQLNASTWGDSVSGWANALRDAANVNLVMQFRLRSRRKLYLYVRQQVETLGVFVHCFSGVDLDTARGLAIFDPIIPIIGINAKDRPPAKTFTLIHELIHILRRQSSLCNEMFSSFSRNEEEVFCNAVAGEFLVPADALKIFVEKWTSLDVLPLEHIEQTATQFSVSKEVVVRRLLDIKRISKNAYDAYNEEFRLLFEQEQEAQRISRQEGKTAGFSQPPERIAVDRTSSALSQALYEGYREEYFSKQNVAHYLGISQSRVDSFFMEVPSWIN